MAKRKSPKAQKPEEPVEEAEIVETPDVEDPKEEVIPDAPEGDAEDDLAPTPDDVAVEEAQEPKARSGFMPLVLGGVVAAALGFAAAYVMQQGNAEATQTLEARLAQQEDQLKAAMEQQDALKAELAGKRDAGDDLVSPGDLDQAIAALAKQSDAKLTNLDERLLAVEKRAIESGSLDDAALSAYQKELDELRAILAEQKRANAALSEEFARLEAKAKTRLEEAAEEAEAVKAQAEKAARATLARAALARVSAALESGEGFAEALGELTAAAGIEAPEALTANAEDGVVTLAQLQSDVAPAARAALDVSRSLPDEGGTTGRLAAFLQGQLGTRSLEPREGDDPDAVLSRVEDAVRKGELSRALEELEGLPEAGRTEMADWEAAARTRESALDAAKALANSLSQN